MIDANTYYANVYLRELAKVDRANEELTWRVEEIRAELTEQCATLAGALKFVAELADAETVLAGLISGANPIDKVIEAVAGRMAREEQANDYEAECAAMGYGV